MSTAVAISPVFFLSFFHKFWLPHLLLQIPSHFLTTLNIEAVDTCRCCWWQMMAVMMMVMVMVLVGFFFFVQFFSLSILFAVLLTTSNWNDDFFFNLINPKVYSTQPFLQNFCFVILFHFFFVSFFFCAILTSNCI